MWKERFHFSKRGVTPPWSVLSVCRELPESVQRLCICVAARLIVGRQFLFYSHMTYLALV